MKRPELLLSLMLAVGCGLGLTGGAADQPEPPRAGQGNLVLAEQEGKLTGSFTYQLIVGNFYEWNTDPTAVPGILGELAKRTGVQARIEFKAIALDSPQLFRNPFLIMTGNRAFQLSEAEQRNLRAYLQQGGFLYVDDCGGADFSVRRMLKQLLPEAPPAELPADHALFARPYQLAGPPKVVDLYHGKAQAFGLSVGPRLAVVYTYDTDVPCAWERYPDGSYVHVVAKDVREAAERFGVNVLAFALRQSLGTAIPPAAGELAAGLPAPAVLPPDAVVNYPMKRQLPSRYLTALAADSDAVWVGGYTFMPGEDEGLARFDKRTGNWRVYMDAEGVLSEEINALVVAGPEVLVGADTWKWSKGVAIFRPTTGKWRTITTADGLPHDRVVGLAQDGDDLWVACRQGFTVLRGPQRQAATIPGLTAAERELFCIGVVASRRYVWVNHFTGILRLDKETGRWEKVADLTALIPQQAIAMAVGGGAVWFLAVHETTCRLVRFDETTGGFAEWPPARATDLTAAAAVAADDVEVLVGTQDDGLYAFSLPAGRVTHHQAPQTLPKGRVFQILADDPRIWVSILPDGGLWGYDRGARRWEEVLARKGSPASHVLALAPATDGLYVGTLAAGPWRLDARTARWQSLNLNLLEDDQLFRYLGDHTRIRWDNIYAIAARDGKAWMATNHGLIVHDPATLADGFEIVGPRNLVCRGLAVLGNAVWVAGPDGQVLAADPATRRLIPAKAWSVPGAIRAMCGWQDALWLATDHGLKSRRWDGDQVAQVVANDTIYGLWPGPTGLWLAADDGLHLLAPGATPPVAVPHSAAWGRINCVYEHGNAVLIGTATGLFIGDAKGNLRGWYNSQSGLGADGIGAILPAGNYLWLGTLGGGMARVNLAALGLAP